MMGETMTKPKDVKVTVLPPAGQDVFFQEYQFDEDLPGRGGPEGMTHAGTRGTDPIVYLKRAQPTRRQEKPPKYGSKAQQTKLKKAEKELAGHENKDAIMKILRSGL